MENGSKAGHKSGAPEFTVRFGQFELDSRTGELRKAGRRIRLQEQPFQILRMLLEAPGAVVACRAASSLANRDVRHTPSHQAEHGLVMLAAEPRLDRAGDQQKPLLVVGPHDAQPPAALRFVDVW